MKAIIADTSCLIIYHKIDQLRILHALFSDLIETEEVANEFGELPDWIRPCLKIWLFVTLHGYIHLFEEWCIFQALRPIL